MSASPSARLRLLALLPALLLTGCVPGVGWMPDSSGFVYTAGAKGDQLRFFDLKSGQARVLGAEEAGPAWPRVSPDGKRIAVVRSGDSNGALLVSVFDREGKELHRSEALVWRGERFHSASFTVPQAHWSPGGDRLLLSWDGRAGLYDPARGDVTPLAGDVMTFGDSPVLPDGKGFLLTGAGLERDRPEFAVADWSGDVRFLRFLDGPRDWPKDGSFPRQLGLMPWFYDSGWDCPAATASWGGHRLRIDPGKGTFAFDRYEPSKAADGRVIQQQLTLAGGAVVRLVEKEPRGPNLADQTRLGRFRVEVLRPGVLGPEVVLEDAEIVTLLPSPDRRAAAVRWSEKVAAAVNPQEGRSGIVVVSGRGVVLARIDTHE
jgi:dipeptidyl aminopeptidase/acylaminoacyl peptidase